MDLYMVILRLIHIFAGIFWVGAASFMLFVMMPAVQKTGPTGMAFIRGFMQKSPFNLSMMISALLTVVAGLLMYYEVSDGFNADWMKSDGGIVLSIGSVAGLLAFGHGASTLGPTNDRITKISVEIDAQGGPLSEAQITELTALGAKNLRNANVSFVMMVITVVGMASARYM